MNRYIEFKNIVKKFPGSQALKDVSFTVEKGEIHALLGENGAGKSTLLNIFHGVFPATSGTISVDGNELSFKSAHDAISFGIAKVHQEIVSVPELSVTENIMLGMEKTKGISLDKNEMTKQTQKLLDTLKCTFTAEEPMKNLSAGQKQMVSIAKALQVNAKIISFDEPTSSLSDNEVKTLFEVINELKNIGVTIIYISHKMDEVFRLCDRATVLRDGGYVASFDIKEINEEKLIQAMVGRDVSLFAQRTKPSAVKKEVIFSVKNLEGKAFRDVSFDLKRGEILGFFGLVGAGRTEVMRAIFGADSSVSQSIKINGKKLNNSSPNSAIKNGIALISENRKEEGFVANLNNMDNIALPSIQNFIKTGWIQKNKVRAKALEIGEMVRLRPNDPEFMTSSLSGGNAQKVILAKWLASDCQVVIFDEPTKGIDIGAKAEIYKLMEDMVAEGKSIIMVSSELTEIIGMSDRIIVMHEGTINGEIMREEFNEERILAFAMGGMI